MPSFAEMVDLFEVKSKSVVNFWINKLVDANLLEKDNKGHLTFTKRSFAIPMCVDLFKPVSHHLKKRLSVTSCPWMNI